MGIALVGLNPVVEHCAMHHLSEIGSMVPAVEGWILTRQNPKTRALISAVGLLP